jgi:hypothetical protein
MVENHGVTASPPLCVPSGGAPSGSPAGPAAANAVRDIILARIDGEQRAFILRMKPHRRRQRMTKADMHNVDCCVETGWEYPDVYWFGGMRASSGAGSTRWTYSFMFNEVGLEVRAALTSSGETQ